MAYAGGGARNAPLPVLRRMTRIGLCNPFSVNFCGGCHDAGVTG